MSKQLREKHRLRDEYELEHLGGYDRIYPLEPEDPRQVRYNEIVKGVYNNEAESQIRKVSTNADTAKKLDKVKKTSTEKTTTSKPHNPE